MSYRDVSSEEPLAPRFGFLLNLWHRLHSLYFQVPWQELQTFIQADALTESGRDVFGGIWGGDPTHWLVGATAIYGPRIGRDAAGVSPGHGIFRARSEFTVAVRGDSGANFLWVDSEAETLMPVFPRKR